MQGVRILDIGQMYAAPVAATLMADLGADVIKIEPLAGDGLRAYTLSAPMEMRGKRSLAVDVRTPEGRQIVLDLVRSADVLMENYTVGTMEHLGLGPADVQAVNPRIVYLRASGFGQTGPYKDRRAMDPIGLAFGGVSHLLRDADGVPQLTGNLFLADYYAAMLGAIATLASLRKVAADPHAKGDVIDVTLYDTLLRVTGSEVINATLQCSRGEQPEELNTRPAPWGAFRSADGIWMMICVVPGPMFGKFVEAVGGQDWGLDGDRVRHELQYGEKDFVNAQTREWAAALPASSIAEILEASGVPVATINTPLRLTEDPHLKAVGAYETHVTDEGLEFQMPSPAPVINGERLAVSRPQPKVGEHTDEILAEVGLDAEAIAKLRAANVVG